MIPFSQAELDDLYTAARTALSQVKRPQDLTREELDGAIYTNMRRELTNRDGLFPIFKGTRKKQSRYPSDKYHFILKLIEEMKMKHLNKDQNEQDLKDLRLSLSQMRDAQRALDKCNSDAERVAEKLLSVNKTLDPHGDEDE